MRDPIPAPPCFIAATRPIAGKLSLTTLPYHVHEIALAFLLYHFILHYLSPTLSRLICPQRYHNFDARTRLNWDLHCVSMVQALFINTAALYVIFSDPERSSMDWRGRLWGYTPASGMVQGFAAGYFLWDLQVSVQHIAVLGPSSLVHAIGALAVTCIGFRPFGNYYGLSFVLYELSTPFLNVHWFCDKLGLSGSRLQLYNGVALLASFFCCRIAWGTYQSFLIYSDIYAALPTSVREGGKCEGNASGVQYSGVSSCGYGELPMWLVGAYLLGNTALSVLNIYWFGLMVKAVRKRFAAEEAETQVGHVKKAQ